MRGVLRSLAPAFATALLVAACGSDPVPAGAPTLEDLAAPTAAPATATPRAVADPAPSVAPSPDAITKLRVFVAAEGPYSGGTGELWVLEASGSGQFETIAKIPMGGWPHNIAVSPNGKWIAVADRSSDQVGIVDPVTLQEISRVKVGKQPHALIWAPDSSVLYVGAEKATYITRLEAGTWRTLPSLQVGVKQHVFAINAARPNELWFSVTMEDVADHARIYDLNTGKIAQIKAFDVHDLYFTPDGSEVWSSSSGFLDKPSGRMLVYDPIERIVKTTIEFKGYYPFHTMKKFQDGLYYPRDTSIMLLSSHYGPAKGRDSAALLWVDWKARKIIDETPLGIQPFHSTYDPLGDRVLVTSNVDGQVNVIDWKTHKIVQKIAVPKPHGIVAVGIP